LTLLGHGGIEIGPIGVHEHVLHSSCSLQGESVDTSLRATEVLIDISASRLGKEFEQSAN
jgi:hypothetical protein